MARIVADPDNARAEFAIVVERELSRLGLGTMLIRRLIEYARGRGIGELYGDVLEDNHVMRHLCRSLGFAEAKAEGQVVRVSLSPAASTSPPEPPLTGAASAPEGRS